MKRYEHDPVDCLSCEHELEFAQPLSPGSGDLDGSFSVCAYCGYVAVFTVVDARVGLREPNEAETVYFQTEYGYFIRLYREGRS